MVITPEHIHHVDFNRAPLGRRGYEENQVDDYLDQVATELRRLITINARLRDAAASNVEGPERARLAARITELEHHLAKAPPPGLVESLRRDLAAAGRDIARLRQESEQAGREIARLRQESEQTAREASRLRQESEKDVLGISTRAVNLLSEAQLSADAAIAEAHSYARELVQDARDQHNEILRRASKSRPAPIPNSDPRLESQGNGYAEPITEIEYVRTYTRIASTQLQAVLDVLAAEVEKLGHLPDLDPGPQLGAGASPTRRRQAADLAPAPRRRL